MNKKWVAPMVLSMSMIASSFAVDGQAALAKSPDQQVSHYNVQAKDGSKLSVPIFVTEKLEQKRLDHANNSKAFLQKNKDRFNMKNPKKQFKVKDKKMDKLGMKHVRLQQTVEGVPVEGAQMVVHYGNNGKVATVNGHYNAAVESDQIATKPAITKSKALKTAKKEVSAPENLPYDPTIKLVVYPFNGKNYLAYKTNVNFLNNQPGNWYVYVNAQTGEVIDKYNALMDIGKWQPATGSGIGVLGDHRKLHISHKNDGGGTDFYLRDVSHNNLDGIFTYDLNNTWAANGFPGDLYSDEDAAFKDSYDRAAVDAHYNSEVVYEYYKDEHNRNSIDGEGMAIISSVHFGKNYNNAFWNGHQMTYGDGDGEFFIPLSAGLDVAAHEMTHGVTHHSAGLVYRGQSGALNEAFSDIFGALVDNDDWEMGEAIMADEAVAAGRTSLRSLDNPSKYKVAKEFWPYGDGSGTYPENMSQFYDLPMDMDNGGVHINSSIINHAAYLTATEIGRDKLGHIYYRALTQYLTPHSDFSDARQAVVQSAVDLYGADSPEAEAAASGFDQVGITGE